MKVVSGIITSKFGIRVHPITGEKKMHNGVDIAAPTGTAVITPCNGQIVLTGYDENAGNRIHIQSEFHQFRFYHLHDYAVATGMHVQSGQIIGYVGNTGASTGSHLHFEVHHNAKPIDPEPFINF